MFESRMVGSRMGPRVGSRMGSSLEGGGGVRELAVEVLPVGERSPPSCATGRRLNWLMLGVCRVVCIYHDTAGISAVSWPMIMRRGRDVYRGTPGRRSEGWVI